MADDPMEIRVNIEAVIQDALSVEAGELPVIGAQETDAGLLREYLGDPLVPVYGAGGVGNAGEVDHVPLGGVRKMLLQSGDEQPGGLFPHGDVLSPHISDGAGEGGGLYPVVQGEDRDAAVVGILDRGKGALHGIGDEDDPVHRIIDQIYQVLILFLLAVFPIAQDQLHRSLGEIELLQKLKHSAAEEQAGGGKTDADPV